jgi:uncharacterized MAPEG superfamily protein
MTIALWCVLVAGILPVMATAIAKSKPGYDNNNPRAWLANQEGFRQRANAAQHNSFEAFPFFAAGVLTAHYLHAAQGTVDTLALTFIAARVAYLICYVADWAVLRSLVWFVAYGSTIGLFVAAARA